MRNICELRLEILRNIGELTNEKQKLIFNKIVGFLYKKQAFYRYIFSFKDFF